ncbi:ty3-gypsy retrotransposon protein [Tanacetum coccineum]
MGTGVEMDKAKVAAVANWSIPTSVSQLRAFLGLTSYYRRFIRQYASIAHPLTTLLQKNNFQWMQQASTYVRELYAITEAAAKFRHYLFGHYFIIRTDHHSLRHISDKTIQTPEQQALLPKLIGYNFRIEYKAGTSNGGVGGLSRCFNFSLSTSQATIVEDIQAALATSSSISLIINQVEKDHVAMSSYHVKNGFLYRKNRMVIPPESCDLISKLLVEFHSSTLGGHAGFLRTYARIATYFFWPGMRRDIRDYILWDDVAMDFITGLPNSRGYTVIMVVIDRLSKYAHFAPLHARFTAPQVATLFVQTIVKLHGIPRSIVSDRDKIFTSSFWSHIFKLQGTSLNMSSAYHPQSDGQSEVLNKCLELYLRCFVFDNPKAWIDFLPWAEFWYNTAFQTSIGVTPFKLKKRDALLAQLKINLGRAQARMKKYVDKKRRELSFAIGDYVFVKLQPYRQQSVKLEQNQKLGMCYFGPFQVLQQIGPVAYKLDLPATSRIHPVFHVSFLKPCVGEPSAQYIPLPLLSTPEGPLVYPTQILDSRKVKVKDEWDIEVLVQWDGRAEHTWESWNRLQQHYPNIDLEGKVCFDEGRNAILSSSVKRPQGNDVENKLVNTSGLHGPVRKSNRMRVTPLKLRE